MPQPATLPTTDTAPSKNGALTPPMLPSGSSSELAFDIFKGQFRGIPENDHPIGHRAGMAGTKDPRVMYPIKFDHLPREEFQGFSAVLANTPTIVLQGTIQEADSFFLHDFRVTASAIPTNAVAELLYNNTRIWPFPSNLDSVRAAVGGLTIMNYLGTLTRTAHVIRLDYLAQTTKQGLLQVRITADVGATYYANISYSRFNGV